MKANQLKISEYLREYIEVLKFNAYEFRRYNLIDRSKRLEDYILEIERSICHSDFHAKMDECKPKAALTSKLETLSQLSVKYKKSH